MTIDEARPLLPVLENLAAAVEDLVSSGLTAATAATRDQLEVSFREASRLKLLRLAASLRYVNEELARFLSESPEFSPRRFALFLNRAWVLARGLVRAVERSDGAALDRLLWSSQPSSLARLDVVCVGVQKTVRATSCSFDFRLRAVGDAAAGAGIADGSRLVWSCVFGRKGTVPAEAYLHLPQPQKFHPRVFLEGRVLTIGKCAVASSDNAARVLLGPPSTVTEGAPVSTWERWRAWNSSALVERLRTYRPSPLDLEVELQEEVVLDGWSLGEPHPREGREQLIYPVIAGGVRYDAVVSTAEEGQELRAALDELRAQPERPPLFGLVHVELCRLVLQPLSLLPAPSVSSASSLAEGGDPVESAEGVTGKKGKPKARAATATATKATKKAAPPTVSAPRQLMLSSEKINLRDLMGSLQFH